MSFVEIDVKPKEENKKIVIAILGSEGYNWNLDSKSKIDGMLKEIIVGRENQIRAIDAFLKGRFSFRASYPVFDQIQEYTKAMNNLTSRVEKIEKILISNFPSILNTLVKHVAGNLNIPVVEYPTSEDVDYCNGVLSWKEKSSLFRRVNTLKMYEKILFNIVEQADEVYDFEPIVAQGKTLSFEMLNEFMEDFKVPDQEIHFNLEIVVEGKSYNGYIDELAENNEHNYFLYLWGGAFEFKDIESWRIIRYSPGTSAYIFAKTLGKTVKKVKVLDEI